MASKHLAALALALGLACAGPAGAGEAEKAEGPKDRARSLARQAVALYQRGDYDGASTLFREAYEIVPAPTIALREARALVKLDRLLEAADSYRRAAATPIDRSSPQAYRIAVAEARFELARLRPKIPRMVLTVDRRGASGLRVTVDGRPFPLSLLGVERQVDPGSYVVSATLPGHPPRLERVHLSLGESHTVVLRLAAPVEAPASSPELPPPAVRAGHAEAKRVEAPGAVGGGGAAKVGWAALAVGGVGLGVGVGAGLAASSRASELEAACPGGLCAPELEGDLGTMRALRTTSIVGYAVGIAGVGTGALLLLAWPGEDRSASAVAVGPGSVTYRRSF